MIIVKAIITRNPVENNLLRGVLHRITNLSQSFDEFKIFHIKIGLNQVVDHWDNMGTSLKQGEISWNDVNIYVPIP
jgi:hypothetical protein